MERLIILGQIPGTHLEITFRWAIVIIGSVIIGYEYRRLKSKQTRRHQDLVDKAL